MRRPSASFYSSVNGESILRAADKAAASKIPPPGRSWEKHRRLGPSMVNSTPNVRAAPAPAGSRPCIGSMRLFASIELDVHSRAASRFSPVWGIVRMAFSTVNLTLLRAI
jgi:hypothetical protein